MSIYIINCESDYIEILILSTKIKIMSNHYN